MSKKPVKRQSADLFVGINVWVLVGTIGWQAAGPILILGVGGAYLDKYLHTSPWIMLLGVAASFAVSYVLVRGTVRRMQRRVEELVRKGVIKP